MSFGHISIPADILEFHPNCFALEVTGDCMEPIVPAGSTVVVDPATLPPKDGSEMGVVEVDGQIHLCRPMHIMGQVVMFHDNKGYRAVTLLDTVARIVGTVVWVNREAGIGGESVAKRSSVVS